MFQIKVEAKPPEISPCEMKTYDLPDREFKITVIQMLIENNERTK
jgi:hypothetical protein